MTIRTGSVSSSRGRERIIAAVTGLVMLLLLFIIAWSTDKRR